MNFPLDKRAGIVYAGGKVITMLDVNQNGIGPNDDPHFVQHCVTFVVRPSFFQD